jgi:unsaturated rhamnogalacturonyl hydrolase
MTGIINKSKQYRKSGSGIANPVRWTVALLLVITMSDRLFCLPISPPKTADSNSNYREWAVKTAESCIKRNPDYRLTYESDRTRAKWNYEQGLMLNALGALWLQTGDRRYYDFIIKNIDQFVENDGTIRTYKQSNYQLDDIGPGRTLLRLYRQTGDEKYKEAADLLRQQLANQPRTSEGGFCHKQIYPWQMWLDGLYMAEPFYAEYEKTFADQPDYADIINQFKLIYSETYDPATGLLYHGWDEKHQQIWADPTTGLPRHFWGRGIGWYLMALVDVLEIIPQDTPDRKLLLQQLNDLAKAIAQVRDADSQVWYQVLNLKDREGNYRESSASAMFIYSFAKGVNRGYLPAEYQKLAEESFRGFINEFVVVNDSGMVDVRHACSGAGLGGKQRRDGSFEYYVSEPQRTNDFKAIGPFIMAAIELDKCRRNNK